MSLTETPAPAPKPAKKRRAIKRKKKPAAAAAPAPKPTGIYAGMTVKKCPDACNAERCVISGHPVCAHPGLGGLQTSMSTPDAMGRLKEAQKYLTEQKWDLVNG